MVPCGKAVGAAGGVVGASGHGGVKTSGGVGVTSPDGGSGAAGGVGEASPYGGNDAAGGVGEASPHSGRVAAGGVVVASAYCGEENAGLVAFASGHGGAVAAGAVVVTSNHGGLLATGDVGLPSRHGGSIVAGGVAEASGHCGKSLIPSGARIVTCLIVASAAHRAKVIGNTIEIRGSTAARNGRRARSCAHIVAAEASNHVGRKSAKCQIRLRFDPVVPLVIHPQLQIGVVNSAHEIHARRSRAVRSTI